MSLFNSENLAHRVPITGISAQPVKCLGRVGDYAASAQGFSGSGDFLMGYILGIDTNYLSHAGDFVYPSP